MKRLANFEFSFANFDSRILWISARRCILRTNAHLMNQRRLRFSFLFLLLFLSLSAMAEKSVNRYRVLSSVRDSSLSEQEALFVFHFVSDNQLPVTSPVKFSYNGTEQIAGPDKKGQFRLKLKPGRYVFQFFYTSEYYEITTDSVEVQPGFRNDLEIRFHSSDFIEVCKKPVIYLYPSTTQSVHINLDLQGTLGFTYPAYNKGWDIVADPDGRLHQNGHDYNYLFWEGRTNFKAEDVSRSEGFLVWRDSLVPFFERTLSAMGLRANEIEDYITYWAPQMQVNECSYVHFLFNDDFGKYAPLTVTPKPDQLFRIFMLWGAAGETRSLTPQQLPSFTRKGFTVVEWGGAELHNDTTIR